MKKTIFGALCLVYAFSAFGRPMLGISPTTLGVSKNELRLGFESQTAKGRYDDAGNYTDFAAGEARESYQLNMNFNYGAAKNNEIDLFIPYIIRSFTKANGNNLACSALGDFWLIGKNKINETMGGKGMFSVCAGVKFPTAKSIFNNAKSTLPSGTGTWDVLGGFSSREERLPFLLSGNVFYVYRFPLKSSVFAGTNISEVNFSLGSQLKYEVAVEYPVSKLFSFVVEYNGSTQYESKAEYTGSNANAVSDMNLLDTTEYTLYKSVLGKLSAGIMITLSEKFMINAGAGLPVIANSTYGGITYFANLALTI